jgi:hypothetical protein
MNCISVFNAKPTERRGNVIVWRGVRELYECFHTKSVLKTCGLSFRRMIFIKVLMKMKEYGCRSRW